MDPSRVNIVALEREMILPGGIWRLGEVELIVCV